MQSSGAIPARSVLARGGLLLPILIALGFALRVALLLASTGHGDVALWEEFGSAAARLGLNQAYRVEPWLNHPPLPVLYAAAIYRLSGRFHLPFPQLFKAPFILADAVACLLFYKIYRTRAAEDANRLGLVAAAIFAWNIDAILLSAFHGNTDPVYAMLCVASVWLADSRRKPLLAGLALGAAINVKLLPGVFVLPMLLLCRTWKEFFRFTFGLAIMSLPFAWMLLTLGHPFRQRVLNYRPVGGSALSDLLIALGSHPLLHHYVYDVLERYVNIGKPLILMCTALPALAMRGRGEWNRYRAVAMAAVIFLLVSPAFAVHYTAMVGAALLAYDLYAGAAWGVISGIQLISFYLFLWNGRFPLAAQYPQGAVGPSKYLEMLMWAWALCWIIREIRKTRQTTAVLPI